MMTKQKVSLASDNWSIAHPSIIQAVLHANEGFAPSYGVDPWTEEAGKLIQAVFKTPCKVYIVPTGTGSNILALKLACQKYESVICTDIAHINTQESGAFESMVGCKLLAVPHQNGKLNPNAVLSKLKSERLFGKHATSPRVISISQPTEVGTAYTLEELASLSKLCQEEGLIFHLDGSRLYNAAVSLGVDLDEMMHVAKVDLLSLGGTKNGLISAEALLIFNSSLQKGSDHLQKQTLQLTSKMRYLSAQYIPFFKERLWHTLASRANQKAQEIGTIIQTTPHLTLSHPIDTNQIFFTAPPAWIPLIQEKIFCHIWNLEKNEIRFTTSWNTSQEDVENVRLVFKQLSVVLKTL